MLQRIVCVVGLLVLGGCAGAEAGGVSQGARSESPKEHAWRPLPLITDGMVDPAWFHTGYGTFAVDGDALRTDCDERGLGLLVYGKEALGDCQVRVVYRSKEPKSNGGVYVRIDDGILKTKGQEVPVATRENGQLTPEGLKAMQTASELELGPWYAVHHGFEVQIADEGDEMHRTGAVYSLAKAEASPAKEPGGWRTMVITLKGEQVLVDLDGKRVTRFDAAAANLPKRQQWHEPKREHRRPTKGYIGLQNHDPGDVVWYKEVSVRPLP
jgi:hypothetical protein